MGSRISLTATCAFKPLPIIVVVDVGDDDSGTVVGGEGAAPTASLRKRAMEGESPDDGLSSSLMFKPFSLGAAAAAASATITVATDV